MDRRIGIVLLLFPVLFVTSILVSPGLIYLAAVFVAATLHANWFVGFVLDGPRFLFLVYAFPALTSAAICAYVWPRDTVEERRWKGRPGIS